jgi:hypothetical protein
VEGPFEVCDVTGVVPCDGCGAKIVVRATWDDRGIPWSTVKETPTRDRGVAFSVRDGLLVLRCARCVPRVPTLVLGESSGAEPADSRGSRGKAMRDRE